jgi:transcription elongation factor Elf1
VAPRTVTCRLCGEHVALPDADWVEQVDWVDDWVTEHARVRHQAREDLPVVIDPDPVTDG